MGSKMRLYKGWLLNPHMGGRWKGTKNNETIIAENREAVTDIIDRLEGKCVFLRDARCSLHECDMYGDFPSAHYCGLCMYFREE